MLIFSAGLVMKTQLVCKIRFHNTHKVSIKPFISFNFKTKIQSLPLGFGIKCGLNEVSFNKFVIPLTLYFYLFSLIS